jgi:chromosome segregation ATPase
LDDVRRMLDELQHDHARERAAAVEKDRQWQQREHELVRRLRDVEQRRDKLDGELRSARTETARLETVAGELAAVQAELARARSEQSRSDERIDESRTEGESVWKARLEESDRERMEMTAELELLLSRAAEMAETLARERREAAQQQAAWEAELGSLRRALDSQPAAALNVPAGKPAYPGRPVPSVPRSATRPAHRPAHGGADPVLDAVVAQFATLKQTDAGRRSAG